MSDTKRPESFTKFCLTTRRCFTPHDLDDRAVDEHIALDYDMVALRKLYDFMTRPQKLLPMKDAPRDGTPILLKTNHGWVEAWFCHKEPTNDVKDDGSYDWICLDESAPCIDGYDTSCLKGWLPLPETK